MLSLKTNTEILTNFLAPVYQGYLNETNNIQESKKNTVEVLVDNITRYASTDNQIDPYTLTPMIQFLEQVIATEIKQLSKQEVTNKNAVVFYKELLYRLHQYNEICLKNKKE